MPIPHSRPGALLLLISWTSAVVVSDLSAAAATNEITIPSVSDPRLELTLLAAEPEIMTPVGLAVAPDQRLFVVESHTHFPPKNYPGPKFDRIKIFREPAAGGHSVSSGIFADGLYHSMNLAFSSSGELYLTHRNGVFAFEDKNHDGVSEARRTILTLDTPGNYPHNGIDGIAFSSDGWLYVGLGENLGVNY